jgi:hypothetical protein
MTQNLQRGQRRLLAVKIAASIALSALVALTVSASPAFADQRRDGQHDDHRGGDRHRDDHGRWGRGGYYPPPPVVYGTPYYAPPPVVYGPGIGIVLPGIAIGIH